MQYIRRHWRGECSLARAFWINMVGLNLVLMLVLRVPIDFEWIEYPVYQSRWQLIGLAFVTVFLYPWQLVGLVRTSRRVWVDEQRSLGPILAMGAVLIGFISQVQTHKEELPTYRELWSYGFQPDPLADYKLTVLSERNLLHLEGYFGFGLTREVEDLLETLVEAESIEGIVLDSGGGRLYEGRAMAELIERHQWDTYSSAGCNSACPLAFVAGLNRSLAYGARMGFHQYVNTVTNETLSGEHKEYAVDRQYYLDRGIDKTLVKRLFDASPEELWWPTPEELEQSNFVHEVVSINDILPEDYRQALYQPISDALNSLAIFRAGSRLEPDFNRNIVHAFWREHTLNGPDLDILEAAPLFFDDWAMLVAGQASDADISTLLEEQAELMAAYPNQCIQMISPERFGNLDYRTITSAEGWQTLEALFTRIVTQPEGQTAMMEPSAFQATAERIQANLGDDVRYMDLSILSKGNAQDFCRAYRRFFQEVLALPDGQGPAFYRRMRHDFAAS